MAWIFGGMDESGVWNDVHCFNLDIHVISTSMTNFDDFSLH